MVTLEEVDKLKVNELKAACKELGLEQTGNKAELAARLRTALEQQAGAGGAEAEPAAEPDAAAAPSAGGAAPAATAAAAAAPATNGSAAAPAAGAAGEQKGRAKIVFTETEAQKFEATKVQVVNVPAAAEKAKVVSEAEKLKQRKDRFKDPDTEALKQRAQRFNLIDPELEKDKQLKRAERFGTKHPELDAIKKEQRAARFGIVDEETKKKQRLDKFKPLAGDKPKADFSVAVKGDEDFEARKQARAARFAAA